MGNTEVIVVCHNPACGHKFTKPLGEYNRSQRLGRPHFCSKSCWGKFQGIINFKDKANKDTSYLRDIIRRDDFSPFRFHLKVIKKSVNQRNKDSSITLTDLKLLWENQQGICPYTGWDLILLPCTTDYENTPLTTNRASVDRIDSAKGYTPDNIQFVAVIANFAKNAFTEKELIEFCHAVTAHKHLGDSKYSYREEFDKNIQPSINNQNLFLINSRRDKYSPFRQHLRLARRRVKNNLRDCTITLEYLKELWEKQGGCCPYTGWKLDNPEATNEYEDYNLHPRRASLDRINSSLGYVPGNVQFVSVIANYAKRDFTEEQLLEFCQAVVEYRQG